MRARSASAVLQARTSVMRSERRQDIASVEAASAQEGARKTFVRLCRHLLRELGRGAGSPWALVPLRCKFGEILEPAERGENAATFVVRKPTLSTPAPRAHGTTYPPPRCDARNAQCILYRNHRIAALDFAVQRVADRRVNSDTLPAACPLFVSWLVARSLGTPAETRGAWRCNHVLCLLAAIPAVPRHESTSLRLHCHTEAVASLTYPDGSTRTCPPTWPGVPNLASVLVVQLKVAARRARQDPPPRSALALSAPPSQGNDTFQTTFAFGTAVWALCDLLAAVQDQSHGQPSGSRLRNCVCNVRVRGACQRQGAAVAGCQRASG